jgi:hypothetical protein
MDISHVSAFSILNTHLSISNLSVQWVQIALRPDKLIQCADLLMASINKIEAKEEEFMDHCGPNSLTLLG